jgi:hypothetical protein
MADEAIGLADAASIPGSYVAGIARAERRIVTIEIGIIVGEFVTKFLGLFVIIEISFSVIFAKSSSRMARSTIPDKKERGFVNFGGILIGLLGQLARVSRGYSMLSIHPGRKVPRGFGIIGITDNNFPRSIGSALLEVVTIRYSIIVMTGAAGLLRTVRYFALYAQRGPVESLQDNLFMQGDLRGNRSGIDEAKEKQN